LAKARREREGVHPAIATAAAVGTVAAAYVPPSRIDTAGTSGPLSDGNAIYLVARRPDDGQLVASTAAQLSRSAEREGELHWRALLDLETGTLGSAIQSESAGKSSGRIDLGDAEVVSPPELVTVR
jgi:hypothetical protein